MAAGRLIACYRYGSAGERTDNITQWVLNKFVAHYGKKDVTKDAIFHYVYAVLHDPVYRDTFALNLKRDFPRIPLYPDFQRWVSWGEALVGLHLGYDDLEPWPLDRVETTTKLSPGTYSKPMLKSDAGQGLVLVNADTRLIGIPPAAWGYKLGNRSAIDWVLDQHKEKTPADATIRDRFNTNRFADYKESMITLLGKVVRVSMETLGITEAMKSAQRAGAAGT